MIERHEPRSALERLPPRVHNSHRVQARIWQAVVEDIVPFVRTQLPPPLRYPLSHVAFPFVRGLMQFFYGHSLATKLAGVVALARCALLPSSVRAR